MNKQEFGNKVSELRRLKNISQTEFAEMLDVSFATINRWENEHYEPTVKSCRTQNYER